MQFPYPNKLWPSFQSPKGGNLPPPANFDQVFHPSKRMQPPLSPTNFGQVLRPGCNLLPNKLWSCVCLQSPSQQTLVMSVGPKGCNLPPNKHWSCLSAQQDATSHPKSLVMSFGPTGCNLPLPQQQQI